MQSASGGSIVPKSGDISEAGREADPSTVFPETERKHEPSSLRRTSPRERVVRRGDTLTGLLQEEYGRVDQQLIDTVKQTNPQIVNPDVILRGSTIVLPEVPEGSQ
ncbi:MAG TPA: hypothetical protein DCZ04_03535 [Syntrophorhabdus aromaticivorans]|nr:hypothetical protein [Syntrophorhabdus aromaticivorans]